MNSTYTIIGLVMLVIGWWWLRAARRGRRVGDRPCCQRCGYQPGTDSVDTATCPECGHRGRMAIGIRRRSKMSLAGASLLILLAAGTIAWPAVAPRFPANAADAYAVLPDWLVVRLVATGSPLAADEAGERVLNDTLSTTNQSRLTDNLIALSSDTTRPLDAAWSDMLVVQFARGRMSPEQAAAYVRSTIEPKLQTRTVVLPGTLQQKYRFNVDTRNVTRRPVQSGRQLELAAYAAIDEIRTNTTCRTRFIETRVNGVRSDHPAFDSQSDWRPFGWGHTFGSHFDLPRGDALNDPWTLAVTVDITISADGKPITTWQTTRTAQARLAKTGETPIPVIRDESELDEITESLTAIRLVVNPLPDLNTNTIAVSGETVGRLRLGLAAPFEHPLMGVVEIVTPDGSYRFGDSSLGPADSIRGDRILYATPRAGTMSHYIRTGWNKEDSNGSLAFWSKLREMDSVDIIFHSEPSAAFEVIPYKSVLDLSLRFDDVPVIRVEDAGPESHSYPVKPEDLVGVPAERYQPTEP